MNWASIWSELWRQSPLAAVLTLALITGARGYWVFGGTHDAEAKQCTADKAAKDVDIKLYRDIAFNCTGIVAERAQQSAKVNEQAQKAQPAASPKPVIATVRIPVIAPVTPQEKAAIQKPKDAQPDTLNKTLNASSEVLQKNDLRRAQVVSAKP